MNKKQWSYLTLLILACFALSWKIFNLYILNYYFGSYKFQNFIPTQENQLSKEEFYRHIGTKNWKLLFVKTEEGIFRTDNGVEAMLMLNENKNATFEYSCNYTFVDSISVNNANYITISDAGDIIFYKDSMITHFVYCKDKSAANFSSKYVSPNIGSTAKAYYFDNKILLHFTDTNAMLIFR